MKTITTLIMILACAQLALAEVPGVTNYQGVLTDESGIPLDGAHDLTFAIYPADYAIDPLWIETHEGVLLDRGVFSVLLGSVEPFPSDLFDNAQRWVGVAVDGGEEVSPRFYLASVPWAMKAAVADVALSGSADEDWIIVGDDMYTPVTGNVGIGVSTPADRFEVRGGALRTTRTADPQQYLQLRNTDYTGSRVYGHSQESNKKGVLIDAFHDGTGAPSGETFIRFGVGDKSAPLYAMVIKESGRVGIGAVAPTRLLSVNDAATAYARLTSGSGNGSTLELKSTYPGPGTWYGRIKFLSPSDAVGAEINYLGIPFFDEPGLSFRTEGYTRMFINSDTGDVGIGTSEPQHRLHVNGDARVDVLHISGADVAEKFPVSETIEPGSVVAIDTERPGKMCLSRDAYDRKVAGVVSGAGDLPTGAILGNLPDQGETVAVALSGRVWVKCDATAQAIEPGDLLTTSAVAGHAMKVTDHARATGAVIGKAMTALASGRGLVLVLVSLQ